MHITAANWTSCDVEIRLPSPGGLASTIRYFTQFKSPSVDLKPILLKFVVKYYVVCINTFGTWM